MPIDHQKTGKWGEDLARRFLEKKGYSILACNYRNVRQEIDLIARIGNELVFVEVKTRKNNDFGFPEEWVDEQKIKHIFNAADAYVLENELQGELRFDIIAITGTNETSVEIEHIEDAFWPGW